MRMLDDRSEDIQVPSTSETRYVCSDGKRFAVISLSDESCQTTSSNALLSSAQASQCSYAALDHGSSLGGFAVQYEDHIRLGKRQQAEQSSEGTSTWKIAVIASLCSVIGTLLLVVIGFKLARRSKLSRKWLRTVSSHVSPELPSAKDDPAWNMNLKENHSSKSLLSSHSKRGWMRRRSAPAQYGEDGEELAAANRNKLAFGIGREDVAPMPLNVDELPTNGLGIYDAGSVPLQRSATWSAPGAHVSFSQETLFPDYSPDHPNYFGKLRRQYSRTEYSRSTSSSSISPLPQAYSSTSHTSHTLSSFSPNALNSSLSSLASSVHPSTYKLPARRLEEGDSIVTDPKEVLQSEQDSGSSQLVRTRSNGSTVYESCANSINEKGHTSTASSSTFASAASRRSSTEIPAVFVPNRRSSLIHTRTSSLPSSPAEAMRRTSLSRPQAEFTPIVQEEEILRAEPAIPKRMSSAADGQTQSTAFSLKRQPSIISMPRTGLFVANGRASPDQSEVGSMWAKE